MRNAIYCLIIIVLLSACKKKETTVSGNTANITLNAVATELPVVAAYKTTDGKLQLDIKFPQKWDEVSFYVNKIDPDAASQQMKPKLKRFGQQYVLRTDDSCTINMFVSNGDAGDGSYDLQESKNDNYLYIDSYNPGTGDLSGTIHATFYTKYPGRNAAIGLSDTVVLDGSFKAIARSIP